MINLNGYDLTLLSEENISGREHLDVINEFDLKILITDLVVLTGGFYGSDSSLENLNDRTGWFYTKSSYNGYVRCFDGRTFNIDNYGARRDGSICPVLSLPEIIQQFCLKKEIEFGEYPQFAVQADMQSILEEAYQNGTLQATGSSYTFDNTKYNEYSRQFRPIKYDEYQYNSKRYIRILANTFNFSEFYLSNGMPYRNGDAVWVEVSPVVWLFDEKTKLFVSKYGLLSGISFQANNLRYDGDFAKTVMKEYLNKYMIRDLTQNATFILSAENPISSKPKGRIRTR